MRPETGTMQFEGDWRGVFIRGDNAFAYAMALKLMRDQLFDIIGDKPIVYMPVDDLIELLEGSNQRSGEYPIHNSMKNYARCISE